MIIENNLKPSQIYNANETDVYWLAIPTRIFVAGNEKCARGYKISKDHITVLSCANASDDHKLKLIVVGKSRKPCSIKNISMQLICSLL